MAGYGAYAGSKFALEAVSDALRREVADFGVKGVTTRFVRNRTLSGTGTVLGHDP
jgi:NAD(P)-dependent dehydrogenase (short-subunit alcohol dehydrogenase family)